MEILFSSKVSDTAHTTSTEAMESSEVTENTEVVRASSSGKEEMTSINPGNTMVSP